MTRTRRTLVACAAGLALVLGSWVDAWGLTITILEPANDEVFCLGDEAWFWVELSDFGDTTWECTWSFDDTGDRGTLMLLEGEHDGPELFATDHNFTTKGQDFTFRVEAREPANGNEATPQHIHFSVVELTLTSETVASAPDGSPDSRTNVGLAEAVVCTLTADPPVGLQPTWEVIGGGSIKPAQGTTTTFTAPRSPDTCTVRATVGRMNATLDFWVFPPDSDTVAFIADTPGAEAGFVWMGCRSQFGHTVGPESVSFSQLPFREHKVYTEYTWPNGRADSFAENYVPYAVNESNKVLDATGTRYKGVAWLFNDGLLEAHDMDWPILQEYESDTGWVEWLPDEVHPFHFSAPGAQARVGTTIGAGPTVWGGDQGPFEGEWTGVW